MSQIIKAHNKNITSNKTQVAVTKLNAPMEGKCRAQNVIYKCVVSSSNNPDKVYIGLSEPEWKKKILQP